MKKLFLVAITILIAFAFNSCIHEGPTKEDLLTQKNGWILTAATSEPPYIMLAEEGEEPEHLRDLMKGYFFDFELDDVYYYEISGALKVNPGKKLPTPEDLADGLGYDKITTLGTWVLTYPKLTTKVPSFYDKDPNGTWTMDQVTITELDDNVLTYKYTWTTPDEPAKKAKRSAKGNETYTFTLTFSKK